MYYKEIKVWKRIDETSAVRFLCFEILMNNKFVVQSADYFYLPLEQSIINSFEKQQIELFIEDVPEIRNITYDTLEEAVQAFQNDF